MIQVQPSVIAESGGEVHDHYGTITQAIYTYTAAVVICQLAAWGWSGVSALNKCRYFCRSQFWRIPLSSKVKT
jgi:hypothetical protein